MHDAPEHTCSVLLRESLKDAKQDWKLAFGDALGTQLIEQIVETTPIAIDGGKLIDLPQHRKDRASRHTDTIPRQ